MEKYDLITILGPTASGKTPLAAALAYKLDTEIISGDSRQVYRRMDLGTGKDLEDYVVNGQQIPYHLIDIVDPGYKYNVFEFQRDFLNAYDQVRWKDKLPILCGGPVERIDHPEEIPVAPLLVEQVAPLFAQQRDMGRPQVAFDQRMGFAVGQCDRCPVALEVHFDIHPVVVNIKNARTCTKRRIVCLYQEKFGLLACQHGLRFCM